MNDIQYYVGEIVLVFDKLEEDWYEGRITHIENEEIFVEYETTHWYHVDSVERRYLKKVKE